MASRFHPIDGPGHRLDGPPDWRACANALKTCAKRSAVKIRKRADASLFALRHPGALRAKGLDLDQAAKGLKPE
jgi:hypothetical protein